MSRRPAAQLVLVATAFAWPLAGLLKELPTTLGVQAGVSVVVGVALAIAFWRTDALATLGALTSLVVGVAGFQADQGGTVGAIVLIWLGVSMAYLPRDDKSVSSLSAAARIFESAAIPALLALAVAAVSTFALRRGLWVGLPRIELHDWLWNPQFMLPLWVGFGVLLVTVLPKWTVLGLVTVATFSAVLVLIVRRPHSDEAALAFLATTAAVTLQLLLYRAPLKVRGAATATHGIALGVCSAAAAHVLFSLRAHDTVSPSVPTIWRYHALVGVIGGCAAGLYREMRESRSPPTSSRALSTVIAPDVSDAPGG